MTLTIFDFFSMDDGVGRPKKVHEVLDLKKNV